MHRDRRSTPQGNEVKLRGSETVTGATQGSPPPKLYRYYSVAKAESLLKHGKVFFPVPADFNDPFDCRFNFLFKASRVKRLRYARELVRRKGADLPKHERKRRERRGVSIRSYELTQQMFLEDMSTRVGILSFAERYDNLLMWSHYADSHKGLCIEFDRTSEPLRSSAVRVQYSQDYPEADFFRIAEARERGGSDAEAVFRDFVNKVYFTKSPDWQYEAEWRVADPTHGRGVRSFPPEAIIRVFLGCRLKIEDRDRVLQWVESGPTNPRLVQARTSKKAFELDFEELRLRANSGS
jgi:hypothetical protein